MQNWLNILHFRITKRHDFKQLAPTEIINIESWCGCHFWYTWLQGGKYMGYVKSTSYKANCIPYTTSYVLLHYFSPTKLFDFYVVSKNSINTTQILHGNWQTWKKYFRKFNSRSFISWEGMFCCFNLWLPWIGSNNE